MAICCLDTGFLFSTFTWPKLVVLGLVVMGVETGLVVVVARGEGRGEGWE